MDAVSAEEERNMSVSRKRAARHASAPIPVLCRFWREDGVWNATAQHLPVAVFGQSFEEASKNLADALTTHFQSLDDAGKLDGTIALLEKKAQVRFRPNEFSADTPFVRMLVPRDREAELACA
jgi:predicted RNase H-like HicB family nuclease